MKLQNYSLNNDSTTRHAKSPQEIVARGREELDEWLLL